MTIYRPDGKTYKLKDNQDLVISVDTGEAVYEKDTWWVRLLRRLVGAPPCVGVRKPMPINSPHVQEGEGGVR